MDNLQFYPTPPEVAALMIEPMLEDREYEHKESRHSWTQRYTRRSWDGDILDPMAGDGALLDWIASRLTQTDRPGADRELLDKKRTMYACEIDYNRRSALLGKGYKVLGSDWMEFNEPRMFGLIVMNPPFAIAAKSILKAWEHIQDTDGRGHLVSLVNVETLRNPNTKEQQVLLNLIEKYGEWESLGQCFQNSPRPTDVEVAVIRMQKPKKESKIKFTADDFEQDPSNVFDEDVFRSNPLAGRNVVKAMVCQYENSIAAIQERLNIQSKLDFYLATCGRVSLGGRDNYLQPSMKFDECIAQLKDTFWSEVFRQTKMSERMPSNFTRKFDEFAKTQKAMAFNESNIWEVLTMFLMNREQIMVEAMLEAFDTITKFHKDNTVHSEGWHSNKVYKVNQRIVYPYGVSYDGDRGLSWSVNRGGYRSNFYDDIDKVLVFVGGHPQEWVGSTMKAISRQCERARTGEIVYSDEFESRFFFMRMYKKGTVHFRFRDTELLNEFNRRVAIERKWIANETDAPHPKSSSATSTTGSQLALL